mmetsp:Transcript_56170/g.93612  ORF Transcript_56170/g.93612 Transcript_56170/m.93612 type:complete len:119 (-) Transcript_56170:81-437(-)
MDDLRQKIISLTEKYDQLVTDVKTLKTKIKKDESTITTLQTEVNFLKQQNGGNTTAPSNQQQQQQQTQQISNNNQTANPDSLDLLFGGDNNQSSLIATTPDQNINTPQTNEFGGWTTF